jgi:hypothetical protein
MNRLIIELEGAKFEIRFENACFRISKPTLDDLSDYHKYGKDFILTGRMTFISPEPILNYQYDLMCEVVNVRSEQKTHSDTD